jgi:DNA ligase-associated metallophosphoesterase
MADSVWHGASAAPAPSEGAAAGTYVGVMGVVMEAFPEGALWWADTRMLVIADMHLEKGSSFAKRGQLVPPYDTSETLGALARLIARLQPHVVVALGDSFHDDEAASRLLVTHRVMLRGLQIGRDWIWVAGNHDPSAPSGVEGQAMDELAVGRLVFRHEPSPGRVEGEIAGHLHPCARVFGRGRSVRRRCFAGDGYRLVLPSFGAYTGGLDVLDRAYGGLFAEESFRAFMLGDDRVYPVGLNALRPSTGNDG